MSILLGGSEIGGMYLGSNEIREMYLGSNLFYSSSPAWPYKTLRISMDGGVTWTDYGRPTAVMDFQFAYIGVTHVEIPDSVTRIGNFAFTYNEIESLHIPKSVKTIGESAFDSNNLTYVDFPETLDSIGNYAFVYNPYLTWVRISSRTSYDSSWDSPFDSNTNIITYYSECPYETLRISMDGGVTWIDYGRPEEVAALQFSYMGITHVELPDSLISIGVFSFAGNEIESLYIPESVKTIEDAAFEDNNLTYVEFPETLDSIGASAFSSNPLLTYVRISSRTSWMRDGHVRTFPWDINIIEY